MRKLIFSVSPEASASIHEHGLVIFNLGNGRLYTSNGTGARIWRAVERRLSLQAITEEISDQYEIAYSTAREHIVRFLNELQRHALIQREAES
jgi:hypothetical protein